MKIYECLKQTHPFDIHLRRKEIEEKLKERIIHYRNSKCFEYQIMEYVMETLSNCKMDLITGDCLYLYSDTSLSEKKLRALEQQYLRMVESCKDWIGNSERECVLTMEELKMNPVKLCDESWYDHFVTYMNRQALLRNNDRPSNIPEIKIEELISQMYDEECFVYKLFSDFQGPVEWDPLTTKIFIKMRLNNLDNLSTISVEEREQFKEFYTFLLATKSSIVDFDIFQMFGRVSTQDLSKFKTEPYVENSLFILFFNYPHPQV
ncbi:Protein CBG05347 [Caenorhabditis briggsae]|nr:Protein CBG05347 [Caenorhabditis briggsae]CAP25840.2 Protein CBG05347 [Caenorhabditis briggsae]